MSIIKNKAYFIVGILLSLASLILMFIGAKSNPIMLNISLICFFIGIAMLMHWSTISYKWICDVCGESFEITFKQNILGFNSGINYKKLHCPKCNKKTMCKGIKK